MPDTHAPVGSGRDSRRALLGDGEGAERNVRLDAGRVRGARGRRAEHGEAQGRASAGQCHRTCFASRQGMECLLVIYSYWLGDASLKAGKQKIYNSLKVEDSKAPTVRYESLGTARLAAGGRAHGRRERCRADGRWQVAGGASNAAAAAAALGDGDSAIEAHISLEHPL